MRTFKDMLNTINKIESEGFDPTKELYGERMKEFIGNNETDEDISLTEGAGETVSNQDVLASASSPIPVQAKPIDGKDYEDYYIVKDRFTSGIGTQETVENIGKSSLYDDVKEEDFVKVKLLDESERYATKKRIKSLENIGAYAGVYEHYDPIAEKGVVKYSDEIINVIEPNYEVSEDIVNRAKQNLYHIQNK